MLFSSLEFLYLFLPITLIVYFACPLRWRNAVLLASSLIFYGSGEPVYVFLMIFTVCADYAFGFWVDPARHGEGTRRRALAAAVIFNLALLGFFKYYDAIAGVLPFSEPLGIKLPIGISFYTFQALSYVIDVYRADAGVQKNLVSFGTYIALFPQLIAGPIVRYRDIDDQLSSREHSFAMAASGVRTFCAGLAKKVLLANSAGEMWEKLSAASEQGTTVVGAWTAIIFYAFQIYFDFSGYSDMAIGLGKIFGFRFPENFDYPYISRSITEFWRRWHITLSSWFREYVYIPLGGNRRGRGRMYLNLLAVWALTGIWHGASLNFLLWGLYYFVILALEKAFVGRWLDRTPAFLGYLWSGVLILVGWVIFVSEPSGLTLTGGLRYVGYMFGAGADGFCDSFMLYELMRNAVLLAVMAIAATPLPKKLFYRLASRSRAAFAAADILSVSALVVCTAYLVDNGYNPFLYFRF